MLPYDEHHFFFRDIWDQFHEADISYGFLISNAFLVMRNTNYLWLKYVVRPLMKLVPDLFTLQMRKRNEPAHEIIVLFVLRKLILQTCMRRHPVGLIFGRSFSFTSILHVCNFWFITLMQVLRHLPSLHCYYFIIANRYDKPIEHTVPRPSTGQNSYGIYNLTFLSFL